MEAETVVLMCSDCGRHVELPPVPQMENWVSITPIEGWSSPPLRCPACTRQVEEIE